MTLKILSFNIHGGYDRYGHRDLRRVHALMQNLDVDIAVFQEMETRLKRGGALADVHTLSGNERPHNLLGLALKEDEGWYGNMIISRYPIVQGTSHDLASPLSYEPRNAVDATIETPMGFIRVLGTHLSLTPWERWSEVQKLVPLINNVDKNNNHPMLFMGDINEWRPSSRLLRHLDTLMTPVPSKKSFPSRYPLFRLDRVWISRCEFPVRAEVIRTEETRILSDHLPLLITLGL